MKLFPTWRTKRAQADSDPELEAARDEQRDQRARLDQIEQELADVSGGTTPLIIYPFVERRRSHG